MKSLKIALLQLMPELSLSSNLEKGIIYTRKAKAQGADIVLFPEMWSVGYTIATDINILKSSAIHITSSFITSFRNIAKELEIAIGITFLEQYDPLPRNTICLIDRFGNIILTYAKIHLCYFGDECRLSSGDYFRTVELNTHHGIIKVGTMICYDREFPESARILMLQGAELILVPNACQLEINRLSQLRSRSFENMVSIATANYPKGVLDCNGHSCAFDGIAYNSSDSCSRDMLVIEAGEQEGIFMADFPIDALKKYRVTEVHGNAYRHPNKYMQLVDEIIEYPFIRSDYRR